MGEGKIADLQYCTTLFFDYCIFFQIYTQHFMQHLLHNCMDERSIMYTCV